MKDFFERLITRVKKKPALLWFAGLVSFLGISLIVVLMKDGLPSVNQTGEAVDSVSAAGLFLDVLLKLGIILLLIYGLYWLAKKFQKGTAVQKNSQLKVLETVRLSPGQSLHLVLVHDSCLLIGATDQNVNCLSSIDLSPEAVRSYQESDGDQQFSSLFQKLIQDRYQQPGDG